MKKSPIYYIYLLVYTFGKSYFAIVLLCLLFVSIGQAQETRTKEAKEVIQNAKKLLSDSTIDLTSVKTEQIQEVLSSYQKALEDITSKKQRLEVNTMGKSLRANLRGELNEDSNLSKANAPMTASRDESTPEIKIQDTEIALLKEQEEKKQLEIAGLIRILELQKKELEVNELRQWRLFYGGGTILLFLSLISFNLYRGNNRKKKANEMLEEEKEKTEIERDKSESLLLNILPKSVADELKTKGKASVKHYEMASVIFTDFKGFTAFAEKMTPTELVGELEKCFTAFDEIMTRHGLEKIKTIGDAYMGVGGVPEANKDNPINVVLAGLDIQRFMEDRKVKHQEEGGDYWDLRLGINSGELIAGVIGKSKFAYDVWGDTVNTASRMESSGEISKVNISGNTYELVKDFFECTHRGKINAKNKGEVDMYFVDRIKPELSEQGQGRTPNEDFSELMKQKGLKT
jgi:class 3 adenylate cyclase